MEINNIKAGIHLKNAIDYIMDEKKTMGQLLVDTYKCGAPEDVIDAFKYIRNKEVIQKGNNLAWTIMQSFSPDDKVTPEEALEIGKTLMKRMYPNHQYIIATHIDKDHIHNHIILNSVNFEDYHKLNSNDESLAELRKISDDLCREHNLSVIEENSKTYKNELKQAIDEAILKSSDFTAFIVNMQEVGYNIKYGKHMSFKNSKMKKYIRSSSISLDYTEAIIKHRIMSKKEAASETRAIYDDKIAYRSKRKMLQIEIDASISKSETYEAFIDDMKRKGFKAKQGKYLSFKGENYERFIRADYLKDRNGNAHYSGAMIRYRIENKEEYKDLMENRITKVIDPIGKQGGLKKWAEKENSKIIDNMRELCCTLVGFEDGAWFGGEIMYAVFMPEYERKAEELEKERRANAIIDEQIKEITNAIKAIDTCNSLSPIIKSYGKIDVSGLDNNELKIYRSNNAKWSYNVKIAEHAEKYYGTLDTDVLNKMLSMLKADKKENQKILTKKEIEFENWENTKYNFEAAYGFNVTLEQANKALDEALKREAEERSKKNIVKRFFRR